MSYVVACNGHDPITGRERRHWHPAGSDHGDAEAGRRRIDRQRPEPTCAASLGGFMSTTWLTTKRTLTRAMANRYRWMIDHNITPRVGRIRFDALRPDDLDVGASSLSIVRSRQATMGRTVERPVETRTSRRRLVNEPRTPAAVDDPVDVSDRRECERPGNAVFPGLSASGGGGI